MKTLRALVYRNMLVYCRNKENVFYSSLSMLIIILLMLVFLGDMNVDIVKGVLRDMDKMPGLANIPANQLISGVRDPLLDDKNARDLVLSMIIAGITVVNGVTVSLGVIGLMIEDEYNNRLGTFYVSPVSRLVLVSGYVTAAFILSMIFSLGTVVLSEIFMFMTGGTIITAMQALRIIGLIILNSFSATCFMFFLSGFAHTPSSYGGLSTLVGTLVGFITGMYIPIGYMPDFVGKILMLFPMCAGSAWMRRIFVEDAVVRTFAGLPKQAIDTYYEYMGITIKLGDNEITDLMKFIMLLVSGLLFLALSAFLMKRKKVRDR